MSIPGGYVTAILRGADHLQGAGVDQPLRVAIVERPQGPVDDLLGPDDGAANPAEVLHTQRWDIVVESMHEGQPREVTLSGYLDERYRFFPTITWNEPRWPADVSAHRVELQRPPEDAVEAVRALQDLRRAHPADEEIGGSEVRRLEGLLIGLRRLQLDLNRAAPTSVGDVQAWAARRGFIGPHAERPSVAVEL